MDISVRKLLFIIICFLMFLSLIVKKISISQFDCYFYSWSFLQWYVLKHFSEFLGTYSYFQYLYLCIKIELSSPCRLHPRQLQSSFTTSSLLKYILRLGICSFSANSCIYDLFFLTMKTCLLCHILFYTISSKQINRTFIALSTSSCNSFSLYKNPQSFQTFSSVTSVQ